MEIREIKTSEHADEVLVTDVITASNKVVEIKKIADGSNQHITTMEELTKMIANRKGALRVLKETMV